MANLHNIFDANHFASEWPDNKPTMADADIPRIVSESNIQSLAEDIREDFIKGNNFDICEDFWDNEEDAHNINKILAYLYLAQTGPIQLLKPFNKMVERITTEKAEKTLRENR